MRHLSKIFFINSANIPYAEVMVDGNVHFSGTQGVGKSTVLRALLFFYNADKLRLGIQQGHKSFDEFYFKYSNSYIVYEVATERGAFSILTFRSQGKVAYRFVDAPFRPEWIIGENGRAESDWIVVREKLQASNIDYTAKIDTYEQYRNIIYGNTHDRSHRFDKYALLESNHYQNIPRSIQNVFLNSKLDADFVKKTIIESMTDREDFINLQAYRPQIADFEGEFDEIDCWFRRDSNGQVAVRTKADKVIETYRVLLAIEYEIRQVWRRLNYSTARTREEIPLTEEKIRLAFEKIADLNERMAAKREEYSRERDKLVGAISVMSEKIKRIGERRKHYKEIKIDLILARAAEEPALRAEKEQKERLLQSLQREVEDIAEKYRRIYQAIHAADRDFALGLSEKMNQAKGEQATRRDELIARRDEAKGKINDAYDEWLEAFDARLNSLQEDQLRAKGHLERIEREPLKKERTECLDDIAAINDEKKDIETRRHILKAEIETLQKEEEVKHAEVENSFSPRIKELQAQADRLKEQIAQANAMLARLDGSLYQWLTSNLPGWEDTIGKVADENDVLYAQGLNPRVAPGHSFFGIEIDLDAVERQPRTPDHYREAAAQATIELEAADKLMVELENERKDSHSACTKLFAKRIAERREESTILNVRLDQIPQRLKDALTKLRRIQEKERQMVEEEQLKRQAEFNEVVLKIEQEKTARDERKAKRDKEVKAADREFLAKEKELKNQLAELEKLHEKLMADKKAESDAQVGRIKKQELDELAGKGADTAAIESCRVEISNLEAKLQTIENERRHVIEYQNDEDSLFSRETEFRNEKKALEGKRDTIERDFNEKISRYEKERRELSDRLEAFKNELAAMKQGLEQYDQMLKVENIVPRELLSDESAEKNSLSCGELVLQMRGAVNRKQQKFDELKRAVNSFNSHFRPNNIFHFRFPQTDEDFLPVANELQDFMDNNKIETYRQRVSEAYKEILNRISREYGQLINKSAEVKKTINAINSDFRERNFAGVIRNIELRTQESADRLIQLLQSIKEFTEEHSLSMGEANLFSGTDRDEVNFKVVGYLKKFMKELQREAGRTELTLSDTFRLQFRIEENDNSTGWVERINNVGSDGTDILVKAMVNIMLINVFKAKAERRQGDDFIIHCMMDEIGKLHPSNVAGILQFANVRNIYLINSSPMGYNADIYRYNYLLTKDGKSQTHIRRLTTSNGL